MSFLDELTDHQKEKIISLPYRVGLWISQSDDTGGDDASAREQQTLANIVDGFARDMFGSETMQLIMTQTVVQKEHWSRWAQAVADVPEDCAMAIDLLRASGDPKDVHAFQNHLMEIGEAVAMAFSEYQDQGGVSHMLVQLSYHIENFKAALAKKKRKSLREFLSISAKERKALEVLAASLGTAY